MNTNIGFTLTNYTKNINFMTADVVNTGVLIKQSYN
jgi:hypothetical protein